MFGARRNRKPGIRDWLIETIAVAVAARVAQRVVRAILRRTRG